MPHYDSLEQAPPKPHQRQETPAETRLRLTRLLKSLEASEKNAAAMAIGWAGHQIWVDACLKKQALFAAQAAEVRKQMEALA